MWKTMLVTLSLVAPPNANAQQADTAQRTPKSVPTAVAWSVVIPGAGQMYVGQTLVGFAMMTLTAVGFGEMAKPREQLGAVCDVTGCRELLGSWDAQRRAGYIGAGVWLFSIATAPLAARDHNRRYGFAAAPVAAGTTHLGFAVRF